MNISLDYLELPATDLEKAKAFYEEVFGWDWTDYGPIYASHNDKAFEVALNGEAVVGPQHESGSENAIGVFPLFKTDDLKAAEVKVSSAGGTIISAPYSYPGGQRFHFTDPSGNVLGVYQPA